MDNDQMLSIVKEKAQSWLDSPIDKESKEAIRHMMDHNETELQV